MENESICVPAIVDYSLELANLVVTHEDRLLLIESFSKVRHLVQRLRMPEARYTELAVIYSSEWSYPSVPSGHGS